MPLRQTSWLLSTICIQFLLLLECKAVVNIKKIDMQWDEDDNDRFYLKSSRKLLGASNYEPDFENFTERRNQSWFWFCLVVAICLFALLLIKCCIKLAREETEETSRITVHPPPRNRPVVPVIQAHGSSRTLAPPATSSRSLIILPEDGIDPNLFLAIENPNYNIFTISVHTSERIDNNPRELQDVPPDYDSVVATNQQINKRSADTSSASQDFDRPPKYEDLNK